MNPYGNESEFIRSTDQSNFNLNEPLVKRILMEMNLNSNEAQVKRILFQTNPKKKELNGNES